MRELTGVLVLAVLAAGCVVNVDADQVVVRDEKRFTVGGDADVSLETFDGSIRIRSWDRSEVLVEIEKRGPDEAEAAALEVRATQDGNRIRVEAPKPKIQREVIGFGSFSSPSVSFIVTLPQKVRLTARTGDGSIAAEQIDGTIELRSGDGSINAADISGELKAHTGDGSVRINNVRGRVALDSGDGSIHVTGRVEDLTVHTGDGSIVVEADEGSTMRTNWDVTTGDGSIVLRVPPDFDADIDASSGDGRVRSEVDGLENSRSEGGREWIKGRIGQGGHVVKLRSGDGSITVANR